MLDGTMEDCLHLLLFFCAEGLSMASITLVNLSFIAWYWVLRLIGQKLLCFSITSNENTSLKVKYSLINNVRIYIQNQNVHILVSNKTYSESQISKSFCHDPWHLSPLC